MSSQYFANLDKESIGKEIIGRVKKFNDYLEATGLRRKRERQYQLYFGKHLGEMGARNTSVSLVGDDGELTAFAVNLYRNLIKHVLALTTSHKPSYDVRAKNSDSKSLQQAKLGSNILDSYVTEKRLGRHMKTAAEIALAMDQGFVYMPWDPSLGQPHTTAPALDKEQQPILDDQGQPKQKILYEGDPSPCAKTPFDIIFDPYLRDWAKRQWNIVRDYENKWDLAARHPEHADEIQKVGTQDQNDPFFTSRYMTGSNAGYASDDYIPVYHFYHIKSESCLSGRYTKVLSTGLVLFDGPIPYEKIPVFRITPGENFDSAEGYSEGSDLAALQEVLNVLISIPFTNQQAFAIQSIWVPDGCTLAPSQISKNLAILKGGQIEPKAIQLTATPKEIFSNIETIKGFMTELMGLNSAVVGEPSPQLKSGAAIGRVQANAIQFSSNFQQSWTEIQEDCGTHLFDLLKSFANTKRIAAIAGKRNETSLAAFTKDDLQGIDRVVVDLGNPLSRTAAGRIDLAESLVGKGLVTNPKDYMDVLETGNLDPMTEDLDDENELIRKENEMLMEGKSVQALVGDTHVAHIKKHRGILNDPELRMKANMGDPVSSKTVQLAMEHIMQHKQAAMTQDPFWNMVSGEPPLLPPMPPMPPPGPNGPPPPPDGGPQGPPPNEPPPGAALPPPPPIQEAA